MLKESTGNIPVFAKEYKEQLAEHKKIFDGDQYLFKFPNSYGASVVRHSGSDGGPEGLWELVEIRWIADGKWDLDASEQEIGFLEEDKVGHYLDLIAKKENPG